MSRRLYLGRLAPDTRPEDVKTFFDGMGAIVDCRVMTGFGFVEFENAKDADDAVNNYNGKTLMGQSIVVEFAKESRPRREFDDRGSSSRSRRPPGHRIIVSGISRDTSWQDLKDFGREVGNVSFADVDRDYRDQGVLEYIAREDAEHAVKELDGKDLRGRAVRVSLDNSNTQRSGPDNYHRSDRRDDRDRGDRYDRDRRDDRRDDRDRDRYRDGDRDRYRDRDDRRRDRDRSRSPRRERDDERRRSPRRDHDDKRAPGDKEDRRRDEEPRNGDWPR
ncbi:unnamed protein product [Mycena citricolor]|uniref:RRM domain-containing protein n=1 Tax=Mycena citricolor TaxID=2018698 RepID=A0AAD2GWF1_9AGAR|nr:unnamed protein product [Mycena citricolor]CAK5277277.1 unnamed protein product [Mycena citricolor]